MTLPVVLEREPLVEAIFEVRFAGAPQLADLLPGLLFGQIEPRPKIHRQPAADIPQPLRSNDPNLAFAATTRLELEQFNIMIGDRNIVIGCKLPYPKWPTFRSKILELARVLSQVGMDEAVERFSLKYTNLISANSFAEQIAKVDFSLRIGQLDIVDNHMNLKVHHQEGEITHILTLITGASGSVIGGATKHGIVVDVDSICNLKPTTYADFLSSLEPRLEKLRQSNKEKFFGCLRKETIEEMGPIYE